MKKKEQNNLPKKDWDSLSNLEINKRICQAVYSNLKGLEVEQNFPGRDEVVVFVKTGEENGQRRGSISCCNWTGDWKDTSIILENHGMSLIKLRNGDWVCVSEFTGADDRRVSHTASSPQRAICIAYLKYMES